MYWLDEHNLPDYMVHARRVCKKNRKHSWIPSDDSTMGCPFCRGRRTDAPGNKTGIKDSKPAIEQVKKKAKATKTDWVTGNIPYGNEGDFEVEKLGG